MSIDTAFWEELATVRRLHGEAILREAKAVFDLEQTRLYIEDALLCSDDDVGGIKDILHGALDVGR